MNMKHLFQDYFMQKHYEMLRNQGMSKTQAVMKTIQKFREYDTSKDNQ